MDKTEAAKTLGVSVRALERLVSTGKLTPAKEKKDGGGFRWVFKAEDLKRYQDQQRTRPIETVPLARDKAEALARLQAEQAGALVEQTAALVEIARTLQHSATLPPPDHSAALVARMVLTVPEAAALSGLGRGAIEAAIANGALDAKPLGPHGARVIRRLDLERYVDSLWESHPKRRGR